MKRQSILGALTALGIISGTLASATLMGTPAALADDWSDSNDRPAWSQRCDRNWDNAYCNPKVNPNRNPDWSDSDFKSDSWNQDQWGNRNRGQWDRNQDRWGNSDQDQWQNQNRFARARLSSGTYIPAYPERSSGRRIVLRRQERYPLTLIVREDIGRSSRRGIVVLPRNSRIDGDLVPTRSGYRFEANQVRFPNGRQAQIWAVSNTVRQNDVYDRYDRNEASISSGAGLILSTILGRSYGSNSRVIGDVYERYPNVRRDLVVIYPDQSLDLTLTRDFVMDWRNF